MCKDETEQMLRTCAKLNTFVCKTALMSHDDELLQSLRDKVQTYERANESTSANLIYLKRIHDQYDRFLERNGRRTITMTCRN